MLDILGRNKMGRQRKKLAARHWLTYKPRFPTLALPRSSSQGSADCRTGGPGETGRPAPNARPQGEIGPEAPSAAAAPQAATPRLRPPAYDTDPSGGARDGELPRLRRPPVRRLDPAHSGSHRAAGGSGASHRARLPCSDLPGLPTALHTSGGTGRRGPGPAAPRRQPAQPDRHATGRRAAADPQRPVVSGHRASVAPQRGGHRERHSPDRAAGPTSGGRDPGPHPRQPSGPRRRNRLASERDQRLRVDFQHPHRTLLPAAGSGQGGGGRSAGRVVLR